jgi:iron complex transport system substrate-binding protein
MMLDHSNPHPPRVFTAREHLLRRTGAVALVLALAVEPLTAAAEDAGKGEAKKPVRVATLLPFVAAALAEVPDRAVVVASVRRSMHDAPTPGVIDLGSPHSPSFEKLAESRPDLVVAERGMHAALAEKLGRTGAEVVLIDTSSVDSTFAGLRTVGAKVNAASEIDGSIAEAEKEIRAQALAQPLETLPIFGTPGSFMLITDRTWLGDLLGKLNFKNAASAPSGNERFPGYVELSDELLAGLKPQIVLLVAHGDVPAIRAALSKRIDEDGSWKSVRAAASRGVHVLDAGMFQTNPGLAMPEAARELRRLAEQKVATAR